MPKYLIKPKRDVDFYIDWSTIVDDALAWSDRKGMLEMGYEEERLDRCDQKGTSAYFFAVGWEGENGEDGEVWRQEGFLLYENMQEFFELAEKFYAIEGDVCNIPVDDIHPDLLRLLEPLE